MKYAELQLLKTIFLMLVPVCYIYEKEVIFFATDYTTQTFHNLKENNRVSLIIDIYDKKEWK